MRTTSVYNSLAVMAAVAVVSGCASTGSANRSIEPPFEWDMTGEFATPGTSLTLTELARARMGDKVFIYYEIKATGFASDEPLRMWSRTAGDFDQFSGSVDSDGIFKIAGTDMPFGVFDYALGQPLDIAVASENNVQHARAKAFPYPIEAHGTNGCSILMSLEIPTGRHWLVTLRGFESGQSVQVVSQFKDEIIQNSETASDHGVIRFPLTFERGARGFATITATSDDRTVALQYSVGYEAIYPTDEQLKARHDPKPQPMEKVFELLESRGYDTNIRDGEK